MLADHSRLSMNTPNIAKSGTSVSERKKCESLVAALSRVEEEARGIGKVLAMVEKVVVGIGGSLQEVGALATGIGTIKEVLGLVEEAVGDPIGTMARRWVMFGQFLSQRDQKLV